MSNFFVFVDPVVSNKQIESILEEAYKSENVDGRPNLIIVTKELIHYRNNGNNEATHPPVPMLTSPYTGKSTEDLATLVKNAEQCSPYSFSNDHFVLMDAETAKDGNLTVVKNGVGGIKTARISPDWVCDVMGSQEVGVGRFDDLIDNADVDGVCRPHRERSKKGGPAQRKQLGT